MKICDLVIPLGLSLFGMHLAGCVAGEVGDVESEDEDVGAIVQPLGGFTELWGGDSLGSRPLAIGDTYTVFKVRFGFGDFVEVALNSTGALLTVPELPSNRAEVTAGASDITATFVGDSAGKTIYARDNRLGAQWSAVCATVGNGIGPMFVDGSTVYWQDSTGIYGVQRFVGVPFRLGTDMSLLGLEGDSLYVQQLRNGVWELDRMDRHNGSYSLIGRNGVPFGGLSYDADYFYWTEGGSTNRIRRMSKVDGTVVTVKSATDVYYTNVVSNGSALYFIETPVGGGAMRIRRKNLANGNFVSAPFPFSVLHQMRILNGSLILTPLVAPNPLQYGLCRGQL